MQLAELLLLKTKSNFFKSFNSSINIYIYIFVLAIFSVYLLNCFYQGISMIKIIFLTCLMSKILKKENKEHLYLRTFKCTFFF